MTPNKRNAPEPEVLVLRPSKRLWFSIAFGLIFVAAATLWAIVADAFGSDPWHLWIAVGFVCMGVFTAICALLALTGEMRLDQQGFTLATLVSSYRYDWADVIRPFSVIRMSGKRVVALGIRAGRWGGRFTNAVAERNRRWIGTPGALLPESVGVSADELAALLNRWRERALAQASTQQRS